jgi:hypothetical protein
MADLLDELIQSGGNNLRWDLVAEQLQWVD